MAVQIQLRNDTAANWTSANPTLAAGELGVETDTDQFKVGDGTTAWTSLAYGGIVGPAGADGTDGADGADGVDGADGGFDSTQTIESKTTEHFLVAADAGKLIVNNAGALTIVIMGGISFPVGSQVDFLQTSASQITFSQGDGATIYSKDGNLKTAAQYSPASIKCIATNTYVLVGDLGA